MVRLFYLTTFKSLPSPVSSFANVCVFAFEMIKWSSKGKKKDLQIEGKCMFDAFLCVHLGFAEQVVRFSLIFGGREAKQVAKHLKYPTGMKASRNKKSQ